MLPTIIIQVNLSEDPNVCEDDVVGACTKPMAAMGATPEEKSEEKSTIEQLLADCSPTAQSTVNAGNRCSIPRAGPPCYEEESDEDGEGEGNEEESNADEDSGNDLTDKGPAVHCILTSYESSPLLSIHQLSSNLKTVATPFDIQEDDDKDDTSLLNQPLPYYANYVRLYSIINSYASLSTCTIIG